MKLTLYPTPGDFLRDNTPFLTQYEPACQLNIGNAQSSQDAPCSPERLFGRFEEDGKAVLFFGNTPPWNLCLNAVPEDETAAEAARELAGYLRENSIKIAGISAREALCQAFMKTYGGEFRQRSTMDIMVLETLVEPPKTEGTFRKAALSDLDLVVAWKTAFYQEALHEEPPENLRERSRSHLAAGDILLMEDASGEPVSMAQTTRRMEHGTAISSVYTPPEHRGRGCCQNTVAALCREVLSSGKRYCTLFVDKKNPISNRVYRKIGFEILEDCGEYRLVSP